MGSVAVEDFLVFDTDGYQDILRIDQLAQGGGNDVIRCTSILPTTPGGVGISGQPVNVGGAWQAGDSCFCGKWRSVSNLG